MEQYLSRREQKYRRNYNRYYNNGNRSEDIWNLYGNVLAYYNQYGANTEDLPYLNVLRSCVDTMLSKLSQTKVRPFFNPVNGTYKTTKVCRNAQVFFDEFYDKQDIYKKLIASMGDALIFDMGVEWIDDETSTVRRIPPWEFHFDAGEMSIGELTRCAIVKKQYPLIALRDKIKGTEYEKAMNASPNAYVCYKRYYDLLGGMEYQYIGTTLISERKIKFTVPPFVWIYYKEPIKGALSDSMIDSVYQIQRMIDELTYKIATASKLSPTNTIFIPKGSDIKASIYASSKIGDVFEYNIAGAGSSNPITVATPPAIDSQYIQLLELFEAKMYNLTGVSQLSAQSKKPSGINSGVALQTLEDVESERHNVVLSNYIRFARDLAERIIDVYPEDEDVLPNRQGRNQTKWKDIKKERDMFNVQFSASSSLSKDPKVKMEQIEKLLSMKVIDPSMASTLLEMPDLEGAYSITTAAYNSNEKTLERIVENPPDADGKYHFFECTDINLLFKQSVNLLLRLDASDENPEVLERLTLFINQLKEGMDELNQVILPPVPVQPMAQENVAPQIA